jgi:YegS/Rv2252/BmrU family lipid kinase
MAGIRARLITNPKSGRGGIDLTPVLPVLMEHGWEVSIRAKQRGGHATILAREAVEEGCDVVVACGGDGTVGEVIDGAVGTGVAVGVLPGGTANLWAHELGVSMMLERAALQLVQSRRKRTDLGHVSVNGIVKRHFLLMAGMGIDASVLEELNKDLKGRVGILAYVPAIGRALQHATPFQTRIGLDAERWEGSATQIVVGNTRLYAAVTSVTPDAVVDDGLLDACIFTPGGPVATTAELASLIFRKRPNRSVATTTRVHRLIVRTNAIVPLQTDGGRVKQTRIQPVNGEVFYSYSVKRRAVIMLVPNDYTGTLFQHQADDPLDEQLEARPSKRAYHVISHGEDGLKVFRDRDGWIAYVSVSPETIGRDESGAIRPIAELLAGLTFRQPLLIDGERFKRQHILTATAIALAMPSEPRAHRAQQATDPSSA